jgi:hypothetical protein
LHAPAEDDGRARQLVEGEDALDEGQQLRVAGDESRGVLGAGPLAAQLAQEGEDGLVGRAELREDNGSGESREETIKNAVLG